MDVNYFEDALDLEEPSPYRRSKTRESVKKTKTEFSADRDLGPKMKMPCGSIVYRSEYQKHLALCYEMKGHCFPKNGLS